jgi:hypothetical protein
MLPNNIARTLAIIREMAEGKILTLRYGCCVGMGEDMRVGFLLTHEDGEVTVPCSLGLDELDRLLERNGIGLPIPDLEG